MIKHKAALAGLIITLTSICACQKARQQQPPPILPSKGPGFKHHHGQEDKRPFEISIYMDTTPGHAGQCLVDWPQATLWKSHSQTVTWFSDDGQQYTVDFTQGSVTSGPFSQPTLTTQANGEALSGDLVLAGSYFTYAIRVGGLTGSICKAASGTPDPGIYVKP